VTAAGELAIGDLLASEDGRRLAEVNAMGFQLQNKQQVKHDQPALGPDFDRGEVDGGQDIRMRFSTAQLNACDSTQLLATMNCSITLAVGVKKRS